MGNFSDKQIKAWINKGEHFELKGDGGGSNLYLSYRKSFSYPSFKFRYRYNGKVRAMTIGSYKVFSLADARKKAKELNALVALGHDVANEKQERKAEAVAKIEAKANAITAGQLADNYFKDKILGNWKHPNIIRSKIEKDIKLFILGVPVFITN